MTTQVIFKIDKKLKEQAMKKAQSEGLPLALVLKFATRAYVKGALDVKLVMQPKLKPAIHQGLLKISKDIKHGKNLSPGFDNAKEAIAYLKSMR